MNVLLRTLGLIFVLFCSGCGAQDATGERDLVYGQIDGQKLRLNVYLPPGTAKALRPAVLFVHGGGWSMGSKENFSNEAMGLAKLGYVTFSIDYRLAANGRNLWPAQLDDTQRAVRWVRAHAQEYHVDPQRMGALGHSAGGQLVAFLGTRETRDNSDAALAGYSSRVQCVVDMSGPVDLVMHEKTLGDGILRNLFGGSAAERPALARDASPLYFVDAKSAPFLIVHGKLDDLVPPAQGELLDAALRQAGVESKLIVFPNEGHLILKQENGQRVIQEALAFFGKHLSP